MMEPSLIVPRETVVRLAWSMLAINLGLAAACRPASSAVAEPIAAPSSDPLDRMRLDCTAGVLDACDEYELQRALCLQFPEGQPCERLRELGEIPPRPPPRTDAFGCRSTQGPIGPHAMICLAEDRLSIRYAGGVWDQWRIEGWQRDDTVRRVIWVASVVDGPTLWLTPEPTPKLASPLANLGSAGVGYHVVGEGGLLHTMLGARDGPAEDELAALPRVEEVCRHTDACERAIMAARRADTPPPPSTGWGEEEVEDEPPPPAARHTLRACHERWSTVVDEHLARSFEPTLPIECGTVESHDGWPSTPSPPYAWPDPQGW